MVEPRRRAEGYVRSCVHWTPANCALLELIVKEVWDLPLRGKQRMYELERRWSLAYPQRPSRAAALLRQLQRIKARQAQPQEVSPHWGVLFGILLYVCLQGPAGGPTLEVPDAPTEPDLSSPYGFLDAWRPKLEAFY